MKAFFSSCQLIFVLLLFTIAVVIEAQKGRTFANNGAEGFSLLTKNDGVFIFDGLVALKEIVPSRVIAEPLPRGESAVALAASQAGTGDFVVIGQRSIAAVDASGMFRNTSIPDVNLWSAAFGKNKMVIALGMSTAPTQKGRAIATTSTDGGHSWSAPNTTVFDMWGGRPLEVSFGPEGFGTAAIWTWLYTTKDGYSWETKESVGPLSHFSIISVLDHRYSVAVVLDERNNMNGLSYTINQWYSNVDVSQYLPKFSGGNDGPAVITAVTILAPMNYFIATNGGEIWHTINGGQTWNRSLSTPDVAWLAMSYSATLDALVAVGSNVMVNAFGMGAVAVSTDKGRSWLNATFNSTTAFIDVVPAVPRPTT